MMIRDRIVGTVLAVVVSTALGLPALAQTPPAAGDGAGRFADAWEDALETEGNLLSNAQFVNLTNLAYQTAIVRVCDTHKLDKEAVGKALDDMIASADKNLTTEQHDERMAAILVAFGARYGLFIAEGHTDKKAFCEAGEKLKESPGGVPLLLK